MWKGRVMEVEKERKRKTESIDLVERVIRTHNYDT